MWIVLDIVTPAEPIAAAIPLAEGKTIVGRDEGCDIVVALSNVSRRHLSLHRKGTEVRFTDLDSAAGTRLNGEELDSGLFRPGDVLEVGLAKLRLAAKPPEAVTPGKTMPLHVAVDGSASRPPQERSFDWKLFRGFLESLRKSSEPKILLEQLLHGVIEHLGAERGFVLLSKGGKKQGLVTVASSAISEKEAMLAVSSTVCRRVLDSGQSAYVNDSSLDPKLRGAPSLAPMAVPRAIMCGPLSTNDKIHGVVYVDKTKSGELFTSAEMQLFETMTGLAAELLTGTRTRNRLLQAETRIQILDARADAAHAMIMGDGPASAELRQLLSAAAPTDVSVLITGETGSGKEVVARALHKLSARKNGPFVAVNCAALARDVIEAELFGAEKGAYTGADERRPGRFELAAGGTLFLDEIGELSMDLQVKLLRVLQERCVVPVGGTRPLPLDFRLLCATNADVEEGVRAGRFRQDLYYRINVLRIPLLPLRERREDILPLARHFLASFARDLGRDLKGFGEAAEKILLAHDWPGNVRELKNAVERAVVVEREARVQPTSLPFLGGSGLSSAPSTGPGDWLDAFPSSYEEARIQFEVAFLERSLKAHDGNIAKVAKDTGLTRQAIYRRLEKLELLPEK